MDVINKERSVRVEYRERSEKAVICSTAARFTAFLRLLAYFAKPRQRRDAKELLTEKLVSLAFIPRSPI